MAFLYTAKNLINSIEWFFVGLAGFFIFQARKGPYDLLLGLPFLLIGVGFVVNPLATAVMSILTPTFNKGVCIFCGDIHTK